MSEKCSTFYHSFSTFITNFLSTFHQSFFREKNTQIKQIFPPFPNLHGAWDFKQERCHQWSPWPDSQFCNKYLLENCFVSHDFEKWGRTDWRCVTTVFTTCHDCGSAEWISIRLYLGLHSPWRKTRCLGSLLRQGQGRRGVGVDQGCLHADGLLGYRLHLGFDGRARPKLHRRKPQGLSVFLWAFGQWGQNENARIERRQQIGVCANS